jgi:hypothetical protein
MKSICAFLENWATDNAVYRAGKSVWDAVDPVGTSADSLKTIGSGAAKVAGYTASGLGNASYNLATSGVGSKVLLTGAGLLGARAIGKKIQERENSSEISKTPKYKAPPKFEGVFQEQNENLPRFPTLSYTQKIPRSPRSIASFFMRRKPNNYSVNASDQSIEAHRKISSRFVKRSAANTGVDRVIGRLVA